MQIASSETGVASSGDADEATGKATTSPSASGAGSATTSSLAAPADAGVTAEEMARNEQIMMRQDASAATLLSPGKGHQGIPLHIPCSDAETPMGQWKCNVGDSFCGEEGCVFS